MADKWPEVLTKEQFINALDQFLLWVGEGNEMGDTDGMTDEDLVRHWVEHMDSIEPCDPDQAPSRSSILSAIIAERAAQDEQWGGLEHDKGHSGNDWIAYIAKQCRYASRAWEGYVANENDGDRAEFRERMVKVAALAVAALESLD